MKVMVIYDSAFGNTEKVAQAIGQALGPSEEVKVLHVREAKPEQIAGLDLLIVGSPTQKFSPLGTITAFLKGIPKDGLQGVKVAAFDTRFPQSQVDEIRILAFFASIFGYAAEPIAKRLEKKGGDLAVPPQPFYVSDTEGPLLEGELESAADWARQIAAKL
jgi:flavodoxin I